MDPSSKDPQAAYTLGRFRTPLAASLLAGALFMVANLSEIVLYSGTYLRSAPDYLRLLAWSLACNILLLSGPAIAMRSWRLILAAIPGGIIAALLASLEFLLAEILLRFNLGGV